MSKFRQLLKASMKSGDTEEWIDIYVTRPIGLVVALVCGKLHIHPNAITALSMVLGVASGYMFYHTDLRHNILGVVLLFAANICDSADGQLARLTGQKTLVGRVLDGFAGDMTFFFVYLAICLRLFFAPMPGADIPWTIWIFVLGYLAGIMSHTSQASLADYYRQIHLYFLKGVEGCELDDYNSQRAVYESLTWHRWLAKLFYLNYSRYCKSQERRTPAFQQLRQTIRARQETTPTSATDAAALRRDFLQGSRPLMKYTNFLSFNSRALLIYITCLAGCPYVYFIIEVTVYNAVYILMRHRHEALCARIRTTYGTRLEPAPTCQ